MEATLLFDRVDPSAPYAEAASKMNELLGQFELDFKRRFRNDRQIAKLFGVGSATTVSEWLSGRRKPRRSQCIAVAEVLQAKDVGGYPDRMALARLYGYPELSDDSGATIPELIVFVEEYEGMDGKQKGSIIDRLKRVEDPFDEYDREMVNDLLRKNWPLIVRAERLAQFADVLTGEHAVQIAS